MLENGDGEVLTGQCLAVLRSYYHLADRVFDFANVAGPWALCKELQDIGINSSDVFFQCLIVRVYKVLRERGDVLGAITQGRDFEGQCAETLLKCLEKLVGWIGVFQWRGDGDDEAKIDGNGACFAESLGLSFFERIDQLIAVHWRQLAQILEKECAFVGVFDLTGLTLGGIGENAGAMAEECTLECGLFVLCEG